MLRKYDMDCLRMAKDLIDKNPARHYTIPEIARHVGMGETKLKTAFKNVYGTGMYKYLHRERMEKAKTLISNSEKSLKEISSILGFKYQNNFSTSFKKQFGVSPDAWRKTKIN
jgi:AraC-like DNA-binding protein